MYSTTVIVVNHNQIDMTVNVVNDLLAQSTPCKIMVIDNGSTEVGTYTKLNDFLTQNNVYIVLNDSNVPLNHIWNKYGKNASTDYVCFLNNDVRITENFIRDNEIIFDENPIIGILSHATNHPDYNRDMGSPKIVQVEGVYQGWDFTIQTNLFDKIPEDMLLFGGDKHLWGMVYQKGFKGGLVLSSPVFHYRGQTVQGKKREHPLIFNELGSYRNIKPLPQKYPEYCRTQPNKDFYIIDFDGKEKR